MKTPAEVVDTSYGIASMKLNLPLNKLITLSILAGMYIAMGGALSVMVGQGFPATTAQNPALSKLLMGLTFPIGLALITLLGAELFTGNCATLVPSFIKGDAKLKYILRNWSIVWLGNFAGALFFAYFMVYLTGILHPEPWHDALCKIADSKCSQSFFVILLKGIGANWFVCLAVWAAITAKGVTAKLLALWFPVATFVVLGYEHSIANMFFIPTAVMEGADISIYEMLVNNLIPATIGNIIGGALFVGGAYAYIYAKK